MILQGFLAENRKQGYSKIQGAEEIHFYIILPTDFKKASTAFKENYLQGVVGIKKKNPDFKASIVTDPHETFQC